MGVSIFFPLLAEIFTNIAINNRLDDVNTLLSCTSIE